MSGRSGSNCSCGSCIPSRSHESRLRSAPSPRAANRPPSPPGTEAPPARRRSPRRRPRAVAATADRRRHHRRRPARRRSAPAAAGRRQGPVAMEENREPRPDELIAEGEGDTLGEAKWNAMKELERRFPGITADCVHFDVLEEPAGERPARVSGEVDPQAWREVAERIPEEPTERVRALVARVVQGLGLHATVDIEETEDEIRATVNGEDLGLLIGKHGATIDAIQHLAFRAAFQGQELRKQVTVDAAGYRDRRGGGAARAEEWGAAGAEGREAYDAVTARAVGPLVLILEYASPLLLEGGVLVAWKGARDHDEEADAAGAAGRLAMRPVEVRQ